MFLIFLFLRYVDLVTTYIGVSVGAVEGNFLQLLLMRLGIWYYVLNFMLSIGVFLVLRRSRLGTIVLYDFMVLNLLVILVNLFCIFYAIA